MIPFCAPEGLPPGSTPLSTHVVTSSKENSTGSIWGRKKGKLTTSRDDYSEPGETAKPTAASEKQSLQSPSISGPSSQEPLIPQTYSFLVGLVHSDSSWRMNTPTRGSLFLGST